MSSVARRACYKCGNVGHYAEVCTSSERLCYNCKQPGHESNQCTMPRTTDTKQCYHCQGLGHIQADCPTVRINGGIPGSNGQCYNCGQTGHLARNCTSAANGQTQPTAPRAQRGGAGFRGRGGLQVQNNRAATCYKCGGPNHYARDCQAQAIKCYACGKLGHISKDCTAPNGGQLNSTGKTCYKCGQPGHISKDCTAADVNGTAPTPAVGLDSAAAAIGPVETAA